MAQGRADLSNLVGDGDGGVVGILAGRDVRCGAFRVGAGGTHAIYGLIWVAIRGLAEVDDSTKAHPKLTRKQARLLPSLRYGVRACRIVAGGTIVERKGWSRDVLHPTGAEPLKQGTNIREVAHRHLHGLGDLVPGYLRRATVRRAECARRAQVRIRVLRRNGV